VETHRLRALQRPAQLERLLEAFISRAQSLPSNSYQIRDARSLPAPLRRLIKLAIHDGRVWTCWAFGTCLALFIGEMELTTARDRGVPVLKVSRYDESGEILENGTWSSDGDGYWARCPD
jgi:hypothetical protein